MIYPFYKIYISILGRIYKKYDSISIINNYYFGLNNYQNLKVLF